MRNQKSNILLASLLYPNMDYATLYSYLDKKINMPKLTSMSPSKLTAATLIPISMKGIIRLSSDLPKGGCEGASHVKCSILIPRRTVG
ncbi:uncharacterized protein LOC144282257 isoform X3 [Canis aureus]